MNNRIVDSKLRFPKFKNKWEFIKFKKYIKLYRGSSPRPIHEYLSDGDGVNWIKIGDTKNCVNYKISSTEEKITYAGAEKSRYVNSGELILANSMTYGKAYLLEISGCIYDGWFVLRDYEQYFDKRFLLYQLNSDILQKQYQKLSAGGIVLNISSDIVYQTNIFHTSIKEQQKIAECLNSIDELIAGEEDKLKELKNHKKGLLQKLFPKNNSSNPKLRFPEFKEDWVKTTLQKLAEYRRGSFPQPYGLPEWYDEHNGFPFIQVYDVDDALKLKKTTKNKISKLAAQQSVFIPKGTLIITIQGSIGRVAITNYDAYIDRTLLLFEKFHVKINKIFIAYTLQILFSIEKQKAPGGIIKTITKEVLNNFTILIPKIEEQNKIAECLNSIDELISAQTEKIEALKLHKKGLMQRLFPSFEEVKDEQQC